MFFFKRHLSSPLRITLFVISLLILGASVIFLPKSYMWQAGICIAISIFLYVCRKQWLAEEISRKIQLFLLTLGIGLAFSYSGWNPLLKGAISQLLVNHPEYKILKEISSPSLLITLLAIISVATLLLKKNTILKEHPNPITAEFPEKDFKAKLKNFIKVLKNDLNNIDIEINWNDYSFTPLDADVEIISNNRKKRKITNLLSSIKKDKKSQVFLVLGDPGSGKSTALRKLTKELLDEAEITGRIPIYINLKDWQDNKEYTESAPVTSVDIYNFIVKRLKGRDIFGDRFIDAYFEKMYENGRLFFILDSFDEIPRVLDANENSWIIDNLSDAFYVFLAGAAESRGILSSRIFRKPTRKFKSKSTLEIRPFNELSIQETFTRSLNNISKGFFKEFSNSALLPIARNPFSAALIIQFLDENQLKLPTSQSDIYKSYIHKRFSSCSEKLNELGITVDELISFCTELSFLIFSSQKSGLEITISELKGKMKHPLVAKTDEIIGLIMFAKIGRLSPVDNKFSFVHRRFNEYFVVLKFVEDTSLISTESIPTDSRWRDALVLFCEIADESFAKYIALFCWQEVKKMGQDEGAATNDQLLRSIHCLRFLVDAFRNRKEIIDEFKNDLAKLLVNNIAKNKNIIIIKFSVEAVGLLEQSKMDRAILLALRTNLSWISEEAFKASRFLPYISKNLEKSISKYIIGFSPQKMLQRKKEVLFALQLSEAFRKMAFLIRLKIIDAYLYYAGLILTILLFPPIAILIVILEMVFPSKKDMLFPIAHTKRTLIAIFVFPFFLLLSKKQIDVPQKESFLTEWTKPWAGNDIEINPKSMEWIKAVFTHYPRALAIAGIVAAIFLAPVLDNLYKLKSMRFSFKRFRSHFFFNLLLLVIMLILISGLIFFVFKAPFWALMSFIVPAAIAIIVGLSKTIVRFILDKRKLRMIIKPQDQNFSREQIAAILASLRSEWAQATFLAYLENNSIVPTGNWPDNKMPFPRLSIAQNLARQEEKWLNLDR